MVLASTSSSSGSNFLIPNATFIYELIMFIVVLGLVARFVLPPLQRARDEREAKIRALQRQSDEGRSEATELDHERHAVLARAHEEARHIVDAAGTEVDRIREDATRRAQEEYEREVARALEVIARERDQLREETLVRLDDIVIEAAERIVGVAVDRERHRDTIARAIAQATTEVGS